MLRTVQMPLVFMCYLNKFTVYKDIIERGSEKRVFKAFRQLVHKRHLTKHLKLQIFICFFIFPRKSF